MLMNQQQTSRLRINERGAALIVSLILLLIMTIIGISAMNGARLEVSMAGMMQREEVAFRGAERALTTAERYTENMVGAFDEMAKGHYIAEDELDVSDTVWSAPDIVSLVKSDVPELSAHDAFIVEYQGVMTVPGSALNDGGDAPIPGDKVIVYRIATRSDTDGRAVRIIESIYTKLYNPMAP
jgi:type IV pilus assembly protein PilX